MRIPGNNETTHCQNCGEVVIDTQPPYSFTENWVHLRSGATECYRPSIAIPRRKGETND